MFNRRKVLYKPFLDVFTIISITLWVSNVIFALFNSCLLNRVKVHTEDYVEWLLLCAANLVLGLYLFVYVRQVIVDINTFYVAYATVYMFTHMWFIVFTLTDITYLKRDDLFPIQAIYVSLFLPLIPMLSFFLFCCFKENMTLKVSIQ